MALNRIIMLEVRRFVVTLECASGGAGKVHAPASTHTACSARGQSVTHCTGVAIARGILTDWKRKRHVRFSAVLCSETIFALMACVVCFRNLTAAGPLLRCSGEHCRVIVHKGMLHTHTHTHTPDCYGISRMPNEDQKWYCQRCEPHNLIRSSKVVSS